ncbi:MAG: DNA-binding transcriptional ArsR family regulator [Devosia sp.]
MLGLDLHICLLEHSNKVKMEIAKLEANAEQASRLLTAMANAKRLRILCCLLDGEMNVGDLEERVGLAQSPLSQHLSKLRAWDFVKTRRDGQQVYYSIASDEVSKILTTLYDIYCD